MSVVYPYWRIALPMILNNIVLILTCLLLHYTETNIIKWKPQVVTSVRAAITEI